MLFSFLPHHFSFFWIKTCFRISQIFMTLTKISERALGNSRLIGASSLEDTLQGQAAPQSGVCGSCSWQVQGSNHILSEEEERKPRPNYNSKNQTSHENYPSREHPQRRKHLPLAPSLTCPQYTKPPPFIHQTSTLRHLSLNNSLSFGRKVLLYVHISSISCFCCWSRVYNRHLLLSHTAIQ